MVSPFIGFYLVHYPECWEIDLSRNLSWTTFTFTLRISWLPFLIYSCVLYSESRRMKWNAIVCTCITVLFVVRNSLNVQYVFCQDQPNRANHYVLVCSLPLSHGLTFDARDTSPVSFPSLFPRGHCQQSRLVGVGEGHECLVNLSTNFQLWFNMPNLMT